MKKHRNRIKRKELTSQPTQQKLPVLVAVHKKIYQPTEGVLQGHADRIITTEIEQEKQAEKDALRERIRLHHSSMEQIKTLMKEKEKREIRNSERKFIIIYLLAVLIILFLLSLSFCSSSQTELGYNFCSAEKSFVINPLSNLFQPMGCSDSLKHNQCSINQPLHCEDGRLIARPSICGCPVGYRASNTACMLLVNQSAQNLTANGMPPLK